MKKYSLSIENKKFEVEVSVEQDVADVSVNGKSFKVKIENSDAITNLGTIKTVPSRSTAKAVKIAPIPQASAATKQASASAGAGVIKSPLPGNVIQILVSIGNSVKRGDVLVVLEAMKMENNILAVNDGVVKSIFVQTGQTVMLGDSLIEVE